MIYELALVIDKGPHWEVTNVTKNTLEGLANRDERFLKLSYIAYKKIQSALNDGLTCHITKDMQTDEVLPGEIAILNASDEDPFESARNAALRKVRMLLTPALASVSSLAFYGFTVLNNDLVDKGYAITAENREENYLKILETGDEALINKLEDYLNYKDEIERVAQLERKFSKYKTEINNASIEAIEGIQNQFLEDFYKTY
jgi:hypothetical protein